VLTVTLGTTKSKYFEAWFIVDDNLVPSAGFVWNSLQAKSIYFSRGAAKRDSLSGLALLRKLCWSQSELDICEASLKSQVYRRCN